MTLHAPRVLLAAFYACRSQLDQPFQKPAGRAGSAACVPQPFSSLVGLPVVAVVEKIDAVQIGSASPPLIGIEKLSRQGIGSKAMALRVAQWVREAPRNIRVRRQWLIRNESSDFALRLGSMRR